MTAKKSINKPQKEEVKEKEVIVEEHKKEEVEKSYKAKSAKDLGFEKRNYFISGKKILIEAGKCYSQKEFDEFDTRAKAIFFIQ